MNKTMEALVKKYPRPGIWREKVPIPEPGFEEIRIEILKTAICGTDVHIYNWDAWAQKTIPVPMVIGHEFVGRIERLGAHVKGFKEGELVSGEGHLVCGSCRNCRAGRRHLCRETRGVGVNRDGAFAEYLCIPSSNVWRCDPNIALDTLAIFDPFGNAVHTALTFELISEDVLITGAGPIGIMAAAVARHAGARHVVITDVNPYRLDLARKVGVTQAVNVATQRLADVMQMLEMKEGFDVGMEMSGNAGAFQMMLKHMFHGGKVALLGILGENIGIDWDLVVFNCLTLKGIYGREMFETWYKMRSMIQSGLDIKPVITHHYHFTQFEKAFECMRSGRSGKIILDWAKER